MTVFKYDSVSRNCRFFFYFLIYAKKYEALVRQDDRIL